MAFLGCRMDQCWLRMAKLERCAFEDCDLTDADFYTATIPRVAVRALHARWCRVLGGQAGDVAFHRSTIDGIKGAEALRNITIGTDQIVPFAFPIFAALGIAIDDDYGDGPDDV